MDIIKIILLVPLILLIIFILTRLKSQLAFRLSLIFVLLSGVVFVLFPSVTNQLAELVGVGRGADLIIYLSIVFFFLFGIMVYSKIRKLQENHTELIRQIAIRDAKKGGSGVKIM